MKITDITIQFEPTAGETLTRPALLCRKSKIWFVQIEGNETRGLYPHELRLANTIQEEIIAKYNQHVKDV